MKNLKTNSRNLLGLALMGALVGAPLMAPTAQAKPAPRGNAYGRDKDKKNKKDRRDDRRDDRNNDGNYNNDRNNGDNYRDDARYTGVVTSVRSGKAFDVRVNGRIYNVTTAGNLPRGLSEGDTVRVAGRLYGDNDIRQATVNITNNTRDDNRDNNANYGPYRTYTGIVEVAGSGNEFNARVDGRIYKIYASSSIRNLRAGDTVRIYGQMYNNRDIRNANVTVTRNGGRNGNDRYDPNNKRDDRYDNRNDDRYNNGNDNFQTFTGVVTKVRSSRDFDIVVNLRTYNVTASQGTSNLNKNDVVRVYGRRYGDNDIRDANVTITRNR